MHSPAQKGATMAEGIQLQAEPIRQILFSATGASYVPIGTALVYPARQIFLQNLTDANMMFSIDGNIDHFVIPAGGFFLSDISTNAVTPDGFFLSKGQRIFVKRIGVPTSGSIYFTTFHGVR